MPVIAPIAELIVQNVIDTVTAYEPNDGGSFDVHSEQQQPASPEDKQVIVKIGDQLTPDSAPQYFKGGVPCQIDEYVLPVCCCVYVIKAEIDEPTLRRFLYGYAADIQKALAVDPNRGTHPTSGNKLAEYTWFNKPNFFINVAPAYAEVIALVRFRTLLNDPYNR